MVRLLINLSGKDWAAKPYLLLFQMREREAYAAKAHNTQALAGRMEQKRPQRRTSA